MKGKNMIYIAIGFIGAVMLASSVIYFWKKCDLISFAFDKGAMYFSTSDVNVSAGGLSFSLKANNLDKEVAWNVDNEN